MLLMVLILNHTEILPTILSELMKQGITRATVLNSIGMVQVIGNTSSVEPPPIFGSLRQFVRPYGVDSKTVLMVLPEEQVETAKAVVRRVTGGLDKPDTGILFTLPILEVEGLS
nr:hypothetical protein [bacterium]